MFASGYTWVILMILHSGQTVVHYTPEGTNELQCKRMAMSAPVELREQVKYAKCVPRHPQI